MGKTAFDLRAQLVGQICVLPQNVKQLVFKGGLHVLYPFGAPLVKDPGNFSSKQWIWLLLCPCEQGLASLVRGWCDNLQCFLAHDKGYPFEPGRVA